MAETIFERWTMGQYYRIVNLTKKEFLSPHSLGDGAKLMEFGCSGSGMMTALAVLLANSNDRGGGDLHNVPEDFPIQAGHWAGDKIVVAGDYAEEDDPGELKGKNLYTKCSDGKLKDISLDALRLICCDGAIAEGYKKSKHFEALRPDMIFQRG